MTVKFEIPGEPCGKGRPRFKRTDRGVRTYTPAKTADYELFTKLAFKSACSPSFSDNEYIRVKIKAFFKIPKDTTKENRFLMLDGVIRPSKKPDADNIAKIICDALNKTAYRDDSQIVELTVEKYYSDIARTEVYMETVDSDE